MAARPALAALVALALIATSAAADMLSDSNRTAAWLALRDLKLAAAAAAAAAAASGGGRAMQLTCGGYGSCSSCASSANCKWCVGSGQCIAVGSSSCPTSNAYLPGDCSCASESGCTSCVNADPNGVGCLFCDATRACMPILDGKCSSYSIVPAQCSGMQPHSSPGACSGLTGCASCTSSSSLCAFCSASSVCVCILQGAKSARLPPTTTSFF